MFPSPPRYRPVLCLSRLKKSKKKAPRPNGRGAVMVRAATYSPGCDPSTIGAAGLNFSVRDGKRWGPCAGPPNVFSIKYASKQYQANRTLSYILCLISCVYIELSRKDYNGTFLFQVFGQLVPLGCAVAGFTPAAYQRCRLQRPLCGSLILGWVSHLDAFSAYPFPTWLPGGAVGTTTGTPAVGPARSSRTKARSPQTSPARNR